jgi:SAM-dependent methyltransferase
MTSFRDLAAAESWAVLRGLLPPPPKLLLEVGCGRGHLAALLQDAGYTVTGLEPDAEAATDARARGVTVLEHGILDHDGGPYDIVLFTRSLHHIDPLDGTVAHAVDLIGPGGVLAVEEFRRERGDRAAAEFCFDTQATLASALGIELDSHAHSHADSHGHGDPFSRWTEDLSPTPGEPLHTGHEVLAAIAARAEVRDVLETPTLWRLVLHPIDKQAPDEAARAASTVLQIERRRIADGTLPAIGFIAVADPH